MKIKLVLLVILVIFILPIAFGRSNVVDQPTETVKQVKEELIDVTSSLNTYRASDVYKYLKGCVEEVKKLKDFVKNSKDIDEVLMKTRKVLTVIYERFVRINSYREDILYTYEDYINTIKLNIGKTDKVIIDIQKTIDELTKKASKTSNSIELKSIEARIKILKARKKLFLKFKQTIEKLPDKTQDFKKLIETFLDVVKYSIPVYKEAINYINNAQDLREFTKEYTYIMELSNLGDGIMDSWKDIQEIVEEINKILSSRDTLELNVVKGSIFPLLDWILSLFKKKNVKGSITWVDVSKMMKYFSQEYEEAFKLLGKEGSSEK